MGNTSFYLLGPLVVGWFTLFGRRALEMRKEAKFRESWADVLWAILPALIFALYSYSTSEANVEARNITLGVLGAFAGAAAAIWVGYQLSGTAVAQQADHPAPPGQAQTGNFSVNQHGGTVNQTYINQAVMPELRQISQTSKINPDGSQTAKLVVQIVAPTTPSSLYLELSASGLRDVQILQSNAAISTINMQDVTRSSESFSGSLQAPRGSYDILVTTAKPTKISFNYKF
jgi:hypothetical protein